MSYLDKVDAVLERIRSDGDDPRPALSKRTASELSAMSLDDFATAGLVVTVHSAALGRRVLLVSDNVLQKRIGHPDLPVFRASELKKLAALRPPPASLRTLAEVKAVFRADNPTLEEATHE